MGRNVARKLAEDLERRNVLQPDKGGYQAEVTKRNQTDIQLLRTIAKERKISAAVDIVDEFNRVLFKVLMELPLRYGVSLTFTTFTGTPVKEGRHATWKQGL